MDDPDITMGEYVQLETDRALKNGKVNNWETATYGKIRYDEDIHYLRFFETKFPAIVYDNALTSEPTVSSQHIDEVNWKIETSLSECDDEKYEIIYDNYLFSDKIFHVNDLKFGKDNE
nr:hypothetical protein [Tanacetum cinerariifolium]